MSFEGASWRAVSVASRERRSGSASGSWSRGACRSASPPGSTSCTRSLLRIVHPPACPVPRRRRRLASDGLVVAISLAPSPCFEAGEWLTLEQFESFLVRSSCTPSRRVYASVNDQDVHRLARGRHRSGLPSIALSSSSSPPSRGLEQRDIGLDLCDATGTMRIPCLSLASCLPSPPVPSTRGLLLDFLPRLRHETCQQCCRSY